MESRLGRRSRGVKDEIGVTGQRWRLEGATNGIVAERTGLPLEILPRTVSNTHGKPVESAVIGDAGRVEKMVCGNRRLFEFLR